jgi:hypothetical protein
VSQKRNIAELAPNGSEQERKMHQLESRLWFQYLVAGVAVVITLALALPIYFGLSTSSAARIAVPFLAAGAISGFSRLLTLFLPPVLLRFWPRLEQKEL